MIRVSGLILLISMIAWSQEEDNPPRAIPLDDNSGLVEGADTTGETGPEHAGEALSKSGQFIVRKGDARQRGSLVLAAEALRNEFKALTQTENEEVTMPIYLYLYGKPGDPKRNKQLARQLNYGTKGYWLDLHIDLSRGINHQLLKRELLSGLVMQRTLTGAQTGPTDVPVKTPIWFTEGIREALLWKKGNGNRKLYESVFERGASYPLDKFFETTRKDYETMDGITRSIFQVSSGALIMALLDQPNGMTGFKNLCNEIALYDGEYPILLRKHFPGLNLSEKSLVKWWALTLARLADAPLTDVMSIKETENGLRGALYLHSVSSKTANAIPLESWNELDEMSAKQRFVSIRPAQEALNRLSYRCYPSYRPLIKDYQELLIKWAQTGGNDNFQVELDGLSETRSIMDARATRARDYMDFMEISGASELSGSFDDFIKLRKELKEEPRAKRKDPVSDYLNRMDRVYAPVDR